MTHIITKIVGKHYISTNWVPGIKEYETMVFEYKGEEVSWRDIECLRTDDKERAMVNHCDMIWRYAKNA